jgi:DNA gyrase subunit A
LVCVGATEPYVASASATVSGHALVVPVKEVPLLSGAGKGVMLVKLDPKDAVIGAQLLATSDDALTVESNGGKRFDITIRKYAGARAGRGEQLFKRGALERVIPREVTVPSLAQPE